MENFNPFSEEYMPRLDNGAITSVVDNVKMLSEKLDKVLELVRKKEEENNKKIEGAVRQMNEVAETFALVASRTITEVKKNANSTE